MQARIKSLNFHLIAKEDREAFQAGKSWCNLQVKKIIFIAVGESVIKGKVRAEKSFGTYCNNLGKIYIFEICLAKFKGGITMDRDGKGITKDNQSFSLELLSGSHYWVKMPLAIWQPSKLMGSGMEGKSEWKDTTSFNWLSWKCFSFAEFQITYDHVNTN